MSAKLDGTIEANLDRLPGYDIHTRRFYSALNYISPHKALSRDIRKNSRDMGKFVEILPSVPLLVIIVSGLCFYAAEGSPKDLEQPIPFSHKIHAGENKINCQYCHSYTSVSPEAGIPSVQKCMGCHVQVAGRDIKYRYDGKIINFKEEVEKLREYGARGVPIPWKRAYYLPDHVQFSHKPHIRRGFECSTCHGKVEKADIMRRVQDLKMGWCVSCHEANARSEEELIQLKDCYTCHY